MAQAAGCLVAMRWSDAAFGAVSWDNRTRARSAHYGRGDAPAAGPQDAALRLRAARTPPPCTTCVGGHPAPAADAVFTSLATISGTGI